MKHSLIIIALCTMLFSCRKEKENIVLNYPTNVAKFSQDESMQILDQILKMSDDELNNWEKQKGFVSYRTILNNALKEWAFVNCEEEKANFLNKYKDILTIHDETIIPNIKIKLYQSIVNRDGIYQTGNYLNKVTNDVIVSVKKEDYNKLLTLRSLNGDSNSVTSEIDGAKIFRFTGPENKSRQYECGSEHLVQDYFYNKKNCRDDRRIYLEATSYLVLAYFDGTDFWSKSCVSIAMCGSRRNGTFCNWVGYETTLEWRNIKFSLTNTNEITYLDVKFDNIIYYRLEVFTGNYIKGNNIPPVFKNFYGEARSRGTGDNWVIINCP